MRPFSLSMRMFISSIFLTVAWMCCWGTVWPTRAMPMRSLDSRSSSSSIFCCLGVSGSFFLFGMVRSFVGFG